MKAICVTPERTVALRDVPASDRPAPGHLLVDIDSAAINHGDITFLRNPGAIGAALPDRREAVWGASGAGRVVAAGEGVPAHYAGRQVAIYRSLVRTPETIGTWCERAEVPYLTCAILPESVRPRDYSGSLVNAITAYAFLRQSAAEGHRGIVATAGNSGTGRALAALARHLRVPAILLVRTDRARDELARQGVPHVLATHGPGFEQKLAALAAELSATAVFDGVGGDLIGRIAPHLPMHATISFYGFLGGTAPVSVPSLLFAAKDLTMKRFANFETPTVRDPVQLGAALTSIGEVIADPMFRTAISQEFALPEIAAAMDWHGPGGIKAVLVP